MSRYAQNTSVSVEASRAEVERLRDELEKAHGHRPIRRYRGPAPTWQNTDGKARGK